MDNQYAATFGPANPLDLANDDGLITFDDVAVFASNWLAGKEINGVTVGDLETVALGDFDYSGRVDIADWGMLNDANPQAAALAMRMIAFGVPEPASVVLLALMAAGSAVRRR